MKSFTVLLFLVCCFLTVGYADKEFVGWNGDTYTSFSVDEVPKPLGYKTENDPRKQPWVQVLSWKPRAFVYHNFLNDYEAAHIIKLAAPQMKRSTVVGPNGTGVVDGIRTSAGTFLQRNQDGVIKAIEERLAVWTGLPPSHQEDMQVLRYGPSNKYGAHLDGLGRCATVLIYLVPPEEGGETAFPSSDAWLHPEMGEAAQGPFSDCAKGHVAYKPKRGDALLFWDMLTDGVTQDPASQHTGCPVVKGIKWNAVTWIHPKPFRESEFLKSLEKPFKPLPDPGLCTDNHELCGTWAKAGECQKNPGYMVGSGSNTGAGMCRKACGDCEACTSGDMDCFRRNREKGGFLNFDEAELKLAEIGLEAGSVFGSYQKSAGISTA